VKIEQRQKLLEALVESSQGDALIEFLEEQVLFLQNLKNVPLGNSFEIEAKANMRAAIKMEEVIRKLKRLKGEEKPRGKNPYR
jgi:hypothetical protein